jgi:hypothetical protein
METRLVIEIDREIRRGRERDREISGRERDREIKGRERDRERL